MIYGDIILDITSNIENYIIENISGKLGSGLIGLDINYILHNISLDINAYSNINNINYNISVINSNNYILYSINQEENEKNISMKMRIKK